MRLLENYDALLFDLDGTVWAGANALPGAVETINAAQSNGHPVVFITNNASKAPAEVAAKLRALGIAVDDGAVLTSAQAAVELAKSHASPGDPVLVVGAESFQQLAVAAGFIPVDSADNRPVVVLQGHSPDNSWKELSEAALAIRAGATYLASNLDASLPSERGLLVGNGSMVAAVVNATGFTPQSAGKPEPAMFELATENAGAQTPLVIGDKLETDIAGGVAAGMDTYHVLTGVDGHYALISAAPEARPTFIAEDLTALTEELESPDDLRPGAQGGFTATVKVDGAGSECMVRLDGGGSDSTSVHALRTVLQAVWQLPVARGRSPVIEPVSNAAQGALEGWW